MPELRRDPVIGRWVIISTDRGKRPGGFSSSEDNPHGGACPFCPGSEDKTPPEILAYSPPGRGKNTPGWWVRVIPNKFPALEIEGDLNRAGEGMYDKMNGMGAHEVIIETPQHDLPYHEMELSRMQDVFWAFRDRILDLKRDARLEYILIFKNHGAAAGASLSHPHSQLIAMPMVPARVIQQTSGAKRYFDYKERCVYCDINRQEANSGVRLVAKNDDFIAFAPFASRFPFELWIVPFQHSSDFYKVEKNQVANLASIMKLVLGKQYNVLDNPPYNVILHTAPLKTENMPHYHWHIEIIPKLTKLAGFEQGTGFYINPTPPEEAARYLREFDLKPNE